MRQVKVYSTICFLVWLFGETLDLNAQIKDTVYIYFDSTKTNMSKEKFLIPINFSKPITGENVDSSIAFFIKEPIDPNKFGQLEYTTSTFWFNHRIPTEYEKTKFGYKTPTIITRDTAYLKDKFLLDFQFFEASKNMVVWWNLVDKNKKKPKLIIFIIDKDEIKNGKIILREVEFIKLTIE